MPNLGSSLSEAQRLTEIPGVVPSLSDPIPGCAFAPRCAFAVERCRRDVPELVDRGAGHWVACHETARVEAASA